MTANPATTVRLSESELDEIRTLIEQRSAILFDASRERFFSTRLLDFIEEKHLASGTDLLRHIKSSSIEYESLLEQLLTQETSFFATPRCTKLWKSGLCRKLKSASFGRIRGCCGSGARAAPPAKSPIRSRFLCAKR